MSVATNIREALYAGRMSNNQETPPPRNYLSGAAKRKSYRSTPQVSEEKPLKIIKTEEEESVENPMFHLLQEISRNPQSLDQLLPILDIFTTSNNECTIREDNNSNFDYLGHHVELDAEDEEWQEEFKKLDREEGKSDCKDHDRRRQMAKNREYARKCVQKKKDMRKQAEIRCYNILKRIQLEQKQTAAKERNSNFAVDLRKMMNEEGVEEQRTLYEALKSALIKKYDEMFAEDETVNLNFHRFAAAKEEFEKAAIDLRMKNGVIGTLGSRKIRAKQQMEWRQHLYNTSVNEHKLRRETKLAELADDYVRRTVPSAAPLVQSIPKGLLDELIKNDRTSELEEFCRFVAENAHIFDDNNVPEESVVK